MSKFFVVSEEELERLVYSATRAKKHFKEAEAACKSRPLPEWSTHFCDDPFWAGDDFPLVRMHEEIRK